MFYMRKLLELLYTCTCIVCTLLSVFSKYLELDTKRRLKTEAELHIGRKQETLKVDVT